MIVFLNEINSTKDSYDFEMLCDYFLDFDRASHNTLIQKLQKLDIGGKLLSVLGSYLLNRK